MLAQNKNETTTSAKEKGVENFSGKNRGGRNIDVREKEKAKSKILRGRLIRGGAYSKCQAS